MPIPSHFLSLSLPTSNPRTQDLCCVTEYFPPRNSQCHSLSLLLGNHPAAARQPAPTTPRIKVQIQVSDDRPGSKFRRHHRFIPRNEVYLIKNSLGEKFNLTPCRLPSIPVPLPTPFPESETLSRITYRLHAQFPEKIPKKNRPECQCQLSGRKI